MSPASPTTSPARIEKVMSSTTPGWLTPLMSSATSGTRGGHTFGEDRVDRAADHERDNIGKRERVGRPSADDLPVAQHDHALAGPTDVFERVADVDDPEPAGLQLLD